MTAQGGVRARPVHGETRIHPFPYTTFMRNRHFPYALIAAGLLVMLLYPRVLPPDSPAFMRSDSVVGFVYGVCIGVEILGVVLTRRRPACL